MDAVPAIAVIGSREMGIIAFLHREVAQGLLTTLTSPKRTNL